MVPLGIAHQREACSVMVVLHVACSERDARVAQQHVKLGRTVRLAGGETSVLLGEICPPGARGRRARRKRRR